ncbi:mammalian cell entry protein [Mycobacterium sp. SMC-19]|uniref:mammalian cell entry protein n=1 Tax=Mycobacterium sp. SMC-19 TaxID=3381630 RepID=UPI0038771CE5
MSTTTDPEPTSGANIFDEEYPTLESVSAGTDHDATARPRPPTSESGPAMLCGLAVVVALCVLVGWLGFHGYRSHQVQAQRAHFLRVAEQGALNLTTIDWTHAEADVQRILNGATGEFHDGFAKRSQPFIQAVKQAEATTVGTIVQLGLESQTADTAQALALVSVRTAKSGEPEPVPRIWRLRISVQKVDDQIKVADVGFVP